MKKGLAHFTILVFLLIISTTVNAQRTKNFSGDAGNFTTELRNYFKEDKNITKDQEKDCEALFLEYDKDWQKYSAEHQEKVMQIANSMLKLFVRPLPGFFNFLKIQVAMQKSSQSTESFEAWLDGLQLILNTKKVQDFYDAISTTESLLSENCLYNSRTSRWSSSASDFYFRTNTTLEVVFDTPMELTYSSLLDSNSIANTKGVYYPSLQKWEGKGGKLYWIRTDIPENQCWAELRNYSVNVKFPKLAADSAVFVNTNFFKKPLLGRVEDEIGAALSAEKYTFPRFRSYEKEFTINNIFPNIDYSGGFVMNGARFIASGVDKEPVFITIYRNKKPFMKVEAKNFLINKERITSNSATVAIYIDQDSIFNAGLEFRYLHTFKEVTVLNPSERNFYSPFENSYHKMDMFCEVISWRMDDDFIEISDIKGNADSRIQLESENYFSSSRYSEIRGIDNVSGLDRVRAYCAMRKVRWFYIDEFTSYLRMDATQAKLILHSLAKYGFLSVNLEEQKVYVKEKLFGFSKSNLKDIDYDAITLSSSISGQSNATISLKNYDMMLKGVDKFLLSDTQNVVIAPAKQEVIVKKNRDLQFDGKIYAGRFDFNARDCYFSYEKFNINMPLVDSLRFYVTSFTDPNKLTKVKTPLQNLKGEILIDKADNKASLKKMEEYPIFNSLDYSYAYYEASEIQNGVYTSNRFYYKLNPFSIKKMFTFKTDSLLFAGNLNSANIFPTLTEPLKVQPDYSLGFVMETPAAGLPLYGGKGKYNATIDLSYKGLLGRGKITYLTSETQSKDIVFMPDSMYAITDTFFIREQYAAAGTGDYPDTRVGKVKQRWYPYQDKMYLYQEVNPFQMYKSDVGLHGYLVLSPSGLKGAGTSQVDVADLVSNDFSFKSTFYTADTSDFKLKATGFNGLAFNSLNVKSKIDLKNKKGEFTTNDSAALVALDVLQYSTYANKFVWDMTAAELALINRHSEKSNGLETADLPKLLATKQPGAQFVSINPTQEKLNFYALKGKFKYKENVLTAEDVFLVRVADAAIAPGDKKLVIRAQAQMDKLVKAKILADTASKNHLFYNAEVAINSKKDYLASGFADYTDENKAKRPIFFAQIKPNPQFITTATTIIPDTVKFLISPAFAFQGAVIINAQQKYYTFSGGVQLVHKCLRENEELAWTKFESVIVPDSIYIPIAQVPAAFGNGQRVAASILFDKKSFQPYSAFLTNDKVVDNEILSASGFLTFNKQKGEYQIGSRSKLENPQEGNGNYLTLGPLSCDTKGEGVLTFPFKQDHVKILTYGNIRTNNQKQECETDLTLGITFPFDEKVLTFMSQNIQEDLSLEPMNFESPKFKKVFNEVLPQKQALEAADELVSMGEIKKFPEALNYTLLFDNVRLKHNPDTRIGYTYLGRIGLWKTGKTQQYRQMRGGVQIRRYQNTLTLNIYLEVTPDEWYFFSYEELGKTSKIRACSNLEEFNDMLKAIPAESRQVSKDKATYTYSSALYSVKDNFIRTLQGLKTDEKEDLEDVTTEEEQVEPKTPTPKKENLEEIIEDDAE